MAIAFPFISGLNNIANADAVAQRAGMQNAGSSTSASQTGNSVSPSAVVVLSAQAQSAAAASAEAQVDAANAPGFAKLEAAGITVKTVSFADIYKTQLLQTVDPGDTGTVSASALDQQVLAGGGSLSQATALYKEMDENGDGKVSDQEFMDSIPDPYVNADFPQQFIQQLEQNTGTQSATNSAPLDSALILANLAMGD